MSKLIVAYCSIVFIVCIGCGPLSKESLRKKVLEAYPECKIYEPIEGLDGGRNLIIICKDRILCAYSGPMGHLYWTPTKEIVKGEK